MFIKSNSITGDFTAVLAYVDDLLLTGNQICHIQAVKTSLHKAFTIKDLGELAYFLGIEVSRTDSGILLNQRKYILDLLKDCNMEDCKSVTVPFKHGVHLGVKDTPLFEDVEFYRRIVGKLLYLNMTRPDISYTVQQLSQFLNNPAVSHFQAAMHVLQYLKGSINAVSYTHLTLPTIYSV